MYIQKRLWKYLELSFLPGFLVAKRTRTRLPLSFSPSIDYPTALLSTILERLNGSFWFWFVGRNDVLVYYYRIRKSHIWKMNAFFCPAVWEGRGLYFVVCTNALSLIEPQYKTTDLLSFLATRRAPGSPYSFFLSYKMKTNRNVSIVCYCPSVLLLLLGFLCMYYLIHFR